MNAKKCDRCGKYYDNNELKKNEGIPARIVLLRKNNTIINKLYLCDDCFEEFYDFLGVDRCNGCFGAANNDCHICPVMRGGHGND